MNNETPEEAIKKAEEMQDKTVESIILTKQEDGNWKAKGIKNGKELEIRGVKPEDCLGEYLTSS